MKILRLLRKSIISHRSVLNRLHSIAGKQSADGSALVEMAVVLPVMMLIITGFCFIGIAVDNYLILTHATDVGARNLAVGRGQLTDPCAQTVSVIQSAAPGLSTGNLAYSFTIGSSGSLGSSCNTTTDLAYLAAGATATVNVTYKYNLFVFGWKPTTLLMQTQTAEVVQ